MGTIHDRLKRRDSLRAVGLDNLKTAQADHVRTAGRAKMILIARARALKGTYRGNCNRTACQMPGATFWNRGSYSWYCEDCARMLNRANPEAQRELDLDGPMCVDRGIYGSDNPWQERIFYQHEHLHERGNTDVSGGLLG